MKRLTLLLFLVVPLLPAGDLKRQRLDLERFPDGNPPREIFVIEGDVRIATVSGGKVLEIKGDRKEADAGVVLGASTGGAATIEARVLASKAGRSLPRFGVGVHGQSGFRLYVVPARKELHLVKNDEVIKTAAFDWKSGSRVILRLAVSRAGKGTWTVTGMAWTAGDPEPANPQITQETTAPPTRGQCSLWGTPYAGTPIDFDEIKVGAEG
jgi:hypothetical protein